MEKADALKELGNRCRNGLNEYLSRVPEGEREATRAAFERRLEREWTLIEKCELAKYLTAAADLVEHAREKGCPVGRGRGSLPASVVAYLCGITKVNPLAYDLIPERCFNPLRDGYNFQIETTVHAWDDLQGWLQNTYSDDINEGISVLDSPRVTLLHETLKRVAEAGKTTLNVEDIPFEDPVALSFLAGDDPDEVQDCLRLWRPLPKALYPLISGNNHRDLVLVQGLLQCASSIHLDNWTVFQQPSETWDAVIARRKGLVSVPAEVECLEPILSETEGVVVFQEQQLQILHDIGGYSFEQADVLLRNVKPAHASDEEENALREFIEQSTAQGYKRAPAARTWNTIFGTSPSVPSKHLGALKAHIVPYVQEVCRLAYLRVHYTIEYDSAEKALADTIE